MLSVSVVLATYNGGRFLDAQLDSLAGQTRAPAEVVVCDDGSTDDTVRRLEAFAARVPFPVGVHPNAVRKGYRANFMDAADLATSDLISFCDQDDVWLPHKLERVAAAFEDEGVVFAHHNARLVDETGAPIRPLRGEAAFPPVSAPLTADPWFFPLGFCQTFRRDLLRHSHLRARTADFNFADKELAHDQWCFFLGNALGRAAYVDEPLVDYRQHLSNTYGLGRPKGLVEKLDVMRRVDSDAFTRRAAFAASMAAALGAIADDSGEAQSTRAAAQAAGRWYGRIADAYRRRADVYQSATLAGRARAWAGLLSKGDGGGPGPAPLQAKSVLRDAALGVFRLGRTPGPAADVN